MKMNTTSPHDNLPILEEGWRCEKDNKVSILKRIEKPNSCTPFLEIVKLILYLELIFFIGWIGCVFLSQNSGNTNYNDSKIETSHACVPSTIDCTQPDINNQINHERRMTGFRAKRNSDEDELKFESCNRTMMGNREKISQLTKQFIPGDDSDLDIIMLRSMCESQIVNVTIRVIMDKLISNTVSSELTDEQWRAFALDIKQRMINNTGEEHRQRVESSGPPTPEIVTELRNTIESMIRNYKDCEKIMQIKDEPSVSPSLGELLNGREKCEKISFTLKEDARPLINQIIPGDSSDPSIVDLRLKVENIITLMASSLIVDGEPTWNFDTISDHVGNFTDEKWRKFIDSIRDDVVNSSSSAQRELLETRAPITQEMINDIRTGVSEHLNKVKYCNDLTGFINKIRSDIEEVRTRTKRDSVPTSEHGLLSDYLENGELDMGKLYAFTNIDPDNGRIF